jgi:hypothetical protein
VLGSGHPNTIIGRANLAIFYDSAGRNGDAIALLNRVLADAERVLGPDHPQTVTIRANLAEAKTAHEETPPGD